MYFADVLDALTDAVVLLDTSGTELHGNVAWRALGERAVLREGCLPADRASLEAGLRAVLAGEQDRFELEVATMTKDEGAAVQRCYAIIVTSFTAEGERYAVVHQRDVTESRLLLHTLQVSHESFAAAQRISHIGNWDWHIREGSLRWSDEIYRIFGLKPQQFAATYEAFLATIHPEDREKVTRAVDTAVRERDHYAVEHRIVLPTGEVRTVSESGEIMCDASGEPIRMIGTVRDITDQKRAEQLIRAQADALRAVSAPLLPVSDEVVVLPLIGDVDASRAEQVMDTLLAGIAERKPTIAILDVTGVPTVDTHTADALLQSARAARLLGVEVILTGVRPDVAQALVALGVDLASIATLSSLQRGIAHALGRVRSTRGPKPGSRRSANS